LVFIKYYHLIQNPVEEEIDPQELVSLTKSNIEGFYYVRDRRRNYRKLYINLDKNILKGTHLDLEFRQFISKGSGDIEE
jgi:hypothetical protein